MSQIDQSIIFYHFLSCIISYYIFSHYITSILNNFFYNKKIRFSRKKDFKEISKNFTILKKTLIL